MQALVFRSVARGYMSACPSSTQLTLFPSHIFIAFQYYIKLIRYWYVLYFSLRFCRVYIHICLQLMGASPQTFTGALPLDPAGPEPLLCPLSKFSATPLLVFAKQYLKLTPRHTGRRIVHLSRWSNTTRNNCSFCFA